MPEGLKRQYKPIFARFCAKNEKEPSNRLAKRFFFFFSFFFSSGYSARKLIFAAFFVLFFRLKCAAEKVRCAALSFPLHPAHRG